ncbi:MAG: transporter [Beijerinckiaceae bacterium]|nr:transporter [Beijerinckiaceae bacterium]
MAPARHRYLGSVILAYCAASLLLAAPAKASEYAFIAYGLGYGIPLSGYTPPPGVYFSDSFFLYSGSGGKNLNFPFGRLTAIGVTADIITNIAAIAWYTDVKIFGGTLGFAAAVPYGSATISAAVSFTGPLGVNRQLNRRQTVAAIGDTAFSAILGWHEGEHHWNAALTGIAPTGKYDPDSLAFMGLNRPAIDLKGGYTYLSIETGMEISGAAGVTFNLRNTATDYRSGIDFHLEGALNQHFPFGLAAGIGGYFYQQLTGDSGSSAVLGPFRGRVAAAGPLLAYTFKAGTQELTISGKWFHEFDVKRRLRGDAVFASISFKL